MTGTLVTDLILRWTSASASPSVIAKAAHLKPSQIGQNMVYILKELVAYLDKVGKER